MNSSLQKLEHYRECLRKYKARVAEHPEDLSNRLLSEPSPEGCHLTTDAERFMAKQIRESEIGR